MEKMNAGKIENNNTKNPTQEAFENIKPMIISKFKPENDKDAEEEFLTDESLTSPRNNYVKYNHQSVESLEESIEEAYRAMESDNSLRPIEYHIYRDELSAQARVAEFLRAGLDYKNATSIEEKSAARDKFMKFNAEIWGEPDEKIFNSLMSDRLAVILEKNFDDQGEKIKAELFARLRGNYLENSGENSRFKPSQETFSHFGNMVKFLYKDQLAIVDEVQPENGESFYLSEVYDILDRIFKETFNAESGDVFGGLSEYGVSWSKGESLSGGLSGVKVPEKRGRGDYIDPDELKGLIVHEMGTHFMRAKMGESYNIAPLHKGLEGYYDTEEGIARAMEMAVSGKYVEAGVEHYITAGLTQFEGMNYRDVFEVNWRLYALEKYDEVEDVSELISRSRSLAFRNTQRIFRGTDELPWFKDLSYFNGGQKVWRYIEENIDNPMLFDNLLLGGKSNVFDKNHERSLYELKTGK